jgi:hypothetical protein
MKLFLLEIENVLQTVVLAAGYYRIIIIRIVISLRYYFFWNMASRHAGTMDDKKNSILCLFRN